MDDFSLRILGIGGIALAVWFVQRARERHRTIDHLVEGAVMAEQRDRVASGTGDGALSREGLPAQLDPAWVLQRAHESHALFQSSPGVFEGWLLMLRDRYNTPREVEILENAEKKIRARMSLLRTSIEANVLAHTAEDEHVIQTLKVRTERIKAEQEHQVAAGTAPLSAENALLKAQLENEKLRKELEEAKAAAMAAHRPLIETREAVRSRERGEDIADARLAADLAEQEARKAKHEAEAHGYRNPTKTVETVAPPPPPPPPKLTPAEKEAKLRLADQAKAEAIGQTEARRIKDLERCRQEVGINSEEYRDRERYWSSRLIALRERKPETFLSEEDQARLHE